MKYLGGLLTGLILLGINLKINAQNKYTISGYVREQGSGELLPGVSIYVPDLGAGVFSNAYGFYSLTLDSGTYVVKFSMIGYNTYGDTINLSKNIEKTVELSPSNINLEKVVISVEEAESEKSQMSTIDIPISNIEDIPAFMGEKDVLKVIQLMPGVQSGSEGSTGFYVRGGGPDQNLIILDEAPVYNANHLFGFFSVFNGDAIKSVELYKGGFPARFGGRLSSVVKLDMKNGNKEKIHGKASIGLISSSLMVEGPLKKKKTSFLISGRRTYIDVLTTPFVLAATAGEAIGGYYFYDLNTKLNHEFDDKNKLYLSGYFGRDNFYARSNYSEFRLRSSLGWGNYTATTRWNHQVNEKMFSNLSLITSRFRFRIKLDERSPDYDFQLSISSSIRDIGLKYDFDYYPHPSHSIKYGIATTNHLFVPSAWALRGDFERDQESVVKYNTMESGVYIEDDMRLFERLKVNAGFRLSHFLHKEVNVLRPEPRLSMAYQLKPDFSMKGAYSTMNQYIHLLSNSGIGLPTDLWVSSTDNVKPQSSQQVALGVAKDFKSTGLLLTVEGYYKDSKDVIAYKEGASFLILDDPESGSEISWEDNVTSGRSWSQGIEILLQKKSGNLSGWLGYTLSRTYFNFDELNNGKTFLARYDRTHDVSLVLIYKFNERVTLSGTWVYGTGNNFTMPIGTYRAYGSELGANLGSGQVLYDFGGKNNFRAEAYHRMDIGVQFSKEKKRGVRTWEIAFYNLYNRRNPFYYYIGYGRQDYWSQKALYRVSMFPILPSFKYTFKF